MAVIGSGPAGLAAAHDLALRGYPVTIFEAAPVPGGMLHLGIPEYRLPRDVVQAQVREILALGPDLRLNSRLGDFSLDDLRAEGFKAILLAIGLHRSRELMLPGPRPRRRHHRHRFPAQRQPRLPLFHWQQRGGDRRGQRGD